MGNSTSQPEPTKHSSTQKRPLRVGILGAGPSGLAAALGLESYAGEAVEVTIIDKNSTVSDYEGVEYAIQERAARALEKIGVKDGALKRGNPMTEFCFYDERRNKQQFSVKQDPKYCFEVFRQHFLIDLEGELKTSKVVRSSMINGIAFPEDGSVQVKLTQKGGDHPVETALDFDVVIACEGLHSPTRRLLFPDQAKVNEYDFHILYMLLEAKDDQEMPKHFREIANGSYLQFNMGHNATNMFFPLGNNRIAVAISFNLATEKKIWAELGIEDGKPWAEIDAENKKKIAGKFAADTKVFDNLFTNVLDLVPDWNSKKIYSWTMRDTDPLPTPYAKEGNVILIGDAAHAMLPCLGLGASLAIEDAELLAESLAKFAKSDWKEETLKSDLQKQVFAPYTAARFPVWDDLMTRGRIAIPNYAGQQTATGFRIAPFIPIPLVAYVFSVAEWIRDLIGRRGY